MKRHLDELRIPALHEANTALLDILVDNSVIKPSFRNRTWGFWAAGCMMTKNANLLSYAQLVYAGLLYLPHWAYISSLISSALVHGLKGQKILDVDMASQSRDNLTLGFSFIDIIRHKTQKVSKGPKTSIGCFISGNIRILSVKYHHC